MASSIVVLLAIFISLPAAFGRSVPHASSVPQHDIEALVVLWPNPHVGTPNGYLASLSVRFKNIGNSNESNVLLHATVSRPDGTIEYQDSQLVPTWPRDSVVDQQFRQFMPPAGLRSYFITAWVSLPNDVNHLNDTTVTKQKMGYLSDAAAMPLLFTSPDSTIAERRGFTIVGSFKNLGFQDFFDMSVRAEILRYPDRSLVYRADTVAPWLITDSSGVDVHFPPVQAKYSTAALAPGYYRVAVIARRPDDGDRTNDTAYHFLTIAPLPPATHDVGISVVQPSINRSEIVVPNVVPLGAMVFNRSAMSSYGVRVFVRITDTDGMIVRSDSLRIDTLAALGTSTVSFSPFTSAQAGTEYVITYRTIADSDEVTTDDTMNVRVRAREFRDIQLISILTPANDTTTLYQVGFRPSVVISRLAGSKPTQPVDLLLTALNADSRSQYRYETTLGPEYFDSDRIVYTAPYAEQYFYNSRVPPGDYSVITVLTTHDDNHTNDTVRSMFHVRAMYDISVDSLVLETTPRRFVPYVPNGLQCIVTNRGLSSEPLASAMMVIYEPSFGIAYDTIPILNLQPGERRTVSFDPFTPKGLDMCSVTITTRLDSDQVSADDRLMENLYSRYLHDVRIDSIVTPRNGDSVRQGLALGPQAFYSLHGFEDEHHVPLEVRIQAEGSDTAIYVSDVTLDSLANDANPELVYFPEPSDTGFRTTDLQPGNYTMAFYSLLHSDENHANDVATVRFTIIPDAVVSRPSVHGLTAISVSPNPLDRSTTVSYSLSRDAAVEVKVCDLLGREVYASRSTVEPAGQHIRSIELHELHDGAYILSLTTRDDRGERQTATRMLVVSHRLPR